jgi:hypothetical protein
MRFGSIIIALVLAGMLCSSQAFCLEQKVITKGIRVVVIGNPLYKQPIIPETITVQPPDNLQASFFIRPGMQEKGGVVTSDWTGQGYFKVSETIVCLEGEQKEKTFVQGKKGKNLELKLTEGKNIKKVIYTFLSI